MAILVVRLMQMVGSRGKRLILLMSSRRSLDNHHEQNKSQFFGRRQGRPFNESRKNALDHIYPRIQITDSKLLEDSNLTPSSLFDNAFNEYHLEIGFGDGKRLSEDLNRNPHIGFLGCEPFINGMTCFLKNIENTDNIRVLMDDALRLCRSLATDSIDRIYILNPDPWHKKRHHKRRIIKKANLDIFAQILKPDGKLILSSDVPYLNDWMITQTYKHPEFEWTAQSSTDWSCPPDNWINTTYETKGAKGADKMCYMVFQKKTCKN